MKGSGPRLQAQDSQRGPRAGLSAQVRPAHTRLCRQDPRQSLSPQAWPPARCGSHVCAAPPQCLSWELFRALALSSLSDGLGSPPGYQGHTGRDLEASHKAELLALPAGRTVPPEVPVNSQTHVCTSHARSSGCGGQVCHQLRAEVPSVLTWCHRLPVLQLARPLWVPGTHVLPGRRPWWPPAAERTSRMWLWPRRL